MRRLTWSLWPVVLLAAVTPQAAAAQAGAPPSSECATSPEVAGPLNDWVRQIFSDPNYAGARAQDSLQTLSPSETVSVWVATGPDCRNLVQDAADALNARYQTTIDWRDMDYVTALIGPYILLIDLGWVGDIRPVVVFNESDATVWSIILSG